jgi:hypothetical protein
VKRKLFAVVTLLLICGGAASWWYVNARAAAGEFPTDVLTLLPEDSAVLVYADMAALRDEPLVQRLAAMAPPVQPNSDYAAFIAATGFKYERDLDRVILASSAAPTAQTRPAHVLAIADGRFDQRKIEAYAQQNGTMQQQNGHSVFTTNGATPEQTTSLTFLSPTRIAVGNRPDVSALLEARTTVAPDAAMQEQISRVAGSPLFVVAKMKTFLTQGNPMLTQFNNLRWVTLAARPDGDRVLLAAEGTTDAPDQAKQLANTLELMRGLMGGMLADPKSLGGAPPEAAQAVSQMLQTAQISSDASRVRLLVSLDTASLTPPHAPAGH